MDAVSLLARMYVCVPFQFSLCLGNGVTPLASSATLVNKCLLDET